MQKTLALVAHDAMKKDMVEWAEFNEGTLARHKLYATKTTGTEITKSTKLIVNLLLSGPLGGDSQIGTMIAEGNCDMVVFFWDPLSPQPHDVDVKALLRLAVLHNVPIACNRSSANYLISSPLFETPE